MSRRFLIATVGCCTTLLCSWGIAGETATDSSALVQEALRAEMQASPSQRAELLEQAVASDPDATSAHWHLGQVERDGRWTTFVDANTSIDPGSDVRQYWSMRSQFGDNFKDQLELANWCRGHDLPKQERVHLIAALDLSHDPNDPQLRARLGFEKVGGRWIDRAQAEASSRSAIEELKEFGRWKSKLESIAGGLASSRSKTREAALSRLRAIDDPGALPAMEAVLSSNDMRTAHLLLDVYANMESHRAAATLARQAVFSPWVTVREAAAEKLKSRPPEEYAAQLMNLLQTPIESQVDVYVRGGTVSLTQTFFQETHTSEQVAVVESTTQLVPWIVTIRERRERTPGDNLTALAREYVQHACRYAQLDAELAARLGEGNLGARRLQREADRHNTAVERLNDRVCAALRNSTGVDLPADSEKWWQWWQDYNDLYSEHEKPREYTYVSEEEVEVVGPIVLRTSESCLSAGTLVWTDRGPLPVESVQRGDLALSKHPETGELAYKPVLRTTVRPAESLLKVAVGGESFLATGGHTFWVSGEGWLKIRDIQPGMRFHGATAPAVLESLEAAEGQPVYNLVVDDFHTYFVGTSMILSHDPTFAEPTDRLVPGLSLAFDAQ